MTHYLRFIDPGIDRHVVYDQSRLGWRMWYEKTDGNVTHFWPIQTFLLEDDPYKAGTDLTIMDARARLAFARKEDS